MIGKKATLQLLLTLSILSVAVCSVREGFLHSFSPRSSCDPTLECSINGTAGSFVPDPQDCHNYYVCVVVGGDLVASSSPIPCPTGQYFDSSELTCKDETEPCKLPCSSSCSLTCSEPYEIIGFPGDCTKYYICLLGDDKVEVPCPEETPYFDGTTCTTTEASCCDFCTPVCSEAGVQIPDPYDCHSYYICIVEGTPDDSTHGTCPSGSIFDPEIGGCVAGTTCEPFCSDTTPAQTSPSPITEGTTPPETTIKGTTIEETTPPISTTQKTTTVGDGCASTYTCTTDGNFPRCPYCDPSYFSCIGGVLEIKECSGGTVFNTNPSFPSCVSPENCPYP